MFLDHPTRYLFFTGKGGVGKTSVACATAVALADCGRRVLLVSTDPASNLDAVLETPLAAVATPVARVPGLSALNIDPQAAAASYRERVVGPYRGVLPADAVAGIEEQLSGACTVEIAAFDEFTHLLDPAGADGFDHVLFDTAPTGHTLRLLSLPAAWSGFLETNQTGTSCLGPLSGLNTQQAQYTAAVAALADPGLTTLILVTRPDRNALQEAERTSDQLRSLGLGRQELVVNAVFRAADRTDPVAMALERRGAEALEAMPTPLRALPTTRITLRGRNVVGIPALRQLLGHPAPLPAPSVASAAIPLANEASLEVVVEELALAGHGLVLVMGKGGVGKTTIAAAIAVELASRGFPVHLSTTDPAAHLTAVLPAEVPGLRVSRIDPEAESRAYRQKVLDRARPTMDAAGLAVLEEDLRSPCTEEVAVFHAFSHLVSSARREIVVVDTAPTGHTLLLLDATGAYHREVMRTASKLPGQVTTPLMRLKDPGYTRVLIVTLPETTPVQEAAELQRDLRRAGIEPSRWIINASLAAAHPTDPILTERAAEELERIAEARQLAAGRVVVVPWLGSEPIGAVSLRALVRGGPPAQVPSGR